MYLSVIIPCYNELENLKRGVLSQVERYLSRQNFAFEVIISDDASTDGSTEYIKEFIKGRKNFKHIQNPKGGKAFAIKSGVEGSSGDYVLFADMDQSTPISEFDKFIPLLKDGYNVVIGSRGFKRENFPLLRKIASPLFLLFRRFLILPRIRDTQCGFKCFEKTAASKVFRQLYVFKNKRGKGWKVGAWDVELLYIALKLGYRLAEVTVDWSDTDTSTRKQRKFVEESIEMIKEVIRVRLYDLLGRYETK